VRYGNPAAAENALNHFRRDYLPERGGSAAADASSDRGFAKLKAGWTGFDRSGADLTVVLDAPDVESGQHFIDSGLEILGRDDGSSSRLGEN
jgi:hypothetical protein